MNLSEFFRLIKVFLTTIISMVALGLFLGSWAGFFWTLALLLLCAACGLAIAQGIGQLPQSGLLSALGAWASESCNAPPHSRPSSAAPKPRKTAPANGERKTPNDKTIIDEEKISLCVEGVRKLLSAERAQATMTELFSELKDRADYGQEMRIGLDEIAVLYIHGGAGTGRSELAGLLADCLAGFGVISARGVIRLEKDHLLDTTQRATTLHNTFADASNHGLLIDDADWLLDDAGLQQDFWRIARRRTQQDKQLVMIIVGRHPYERIRKKILVSKGSVYIFSMPEKLTSADMATLVGRLLAKKNIAISESFAAAMARHFDSHATGDQKADIIDASSVLNRMVMRKNKKIVDSADIAALGT